MARIVAYSLSIVCACAALWLFGQYRAATEGMVRVAAMPVNVEAGSTPGPGGYVRRQFHMVVTVPLEDGTVQRVTLREAMPSMRFPKTEVVLLHPPGRPEEAWRQAGLSALWPTWLAAGLAVLAFVAGLVLQREERMTAQETAADDRGQQRNGT